MKSLLEILDEHFVPLVGFKDRSMIEQRNAAFAQMESFLNDVWELTGCFDSEELTNQLEAIAEEEQIFQHSRYEEEDEIDEDPEIC